MCKKYFVQKIHVLVNVETSSKLSRDRYKDFRDNTGKRTRFYWELTMFRLIFVLVFEVSTLSFTGTDLFRVPAQ